ncbi:MAG: DUF3604 domain-containing protein [Halioglobus sp.]
MLATRASCSYSSIVLVLVTMGLSEAAMAAREASDRPYMLTEQREPCTQYSPLRTAHFGDLHVHTALSLDAVKQGTMTSPRDAYRYAQGESISIPPYGEEGETLLRSQINRPLDFAGVTDHAELLGEASICTTPGMEGYWSLTCMGFRWLPDITAQYIFYTAAKAERMGFCGEEGSLCREAVAGPWQEITHAAESAYDRSSDCAFTSFVAYEWTGLNFVGESTNVANLHRNVIFRNADVPRLPSSFIESPDAPALWEHLENECSNAGGSCDAVVIPHNSNISMGLMFQVRRPDGRPITVEDARRRQRYETLAEMIQHKGASECFFGPGSTDELCDFEQLPWNSFTGNRYESKASPITPDAGHLREVLKDGLALEQQLGVNPFKFGFIGSTDTHRSLAGGVEERDFQGHGGAGNAAAEVGAKGLPDEWEFNPGGLAVLYAEENNRDSLFSAMQRREAYATSGPRIGVRLFGGWEVPEDMCERSDFVAQGYDNGVPMGGDLGVQAGAAPVFAISAAIDPGLPESPGVDLQRVQIIKGWLDEQGISREKVYEVAGDPGNGASVDTANCETRGSGFKNLCARWQDPNFEKNQHAFYYARVLENPSCRWSTYVCNAQQVDCSNPDELSEEAAQCCLPELKKTVQERAWTSPIWYSPAD